MWKAFQLELKNRFSALENTDTEDNIQGKWNIVKKTYVEAAVDTIGYRNKRTRNGLHLKHGKEKTSS